jgi:hypothetical protein
MKDMVELLEPHFLVNRDHDFHFHCLLQWGNVIPVAIVIILQVQ